MSNIVLDIENVSKQYRLGEVGTGTLSNDLKRWWFSVRGKEDPFLKIGETNDRTQKGESDYVWALRDINFQVEQGQAVGIIGRNGAGKSTLLKLLSRVTKPTTGTIKYKGRIASLLEVGTGFHPEMTGRENIYLNGAILGMTRSEISRKFDEIVDFAGVERYIDTPVKRYSSGMYVRLAFAVAAHLESEILIVDEVLAVGDAEFQKKCLGKMGDVSKGEGRTILFVSHNMASVQNLCEKGILLENGIIKDYDLTEKVLQEYKSSYINSQNNVSNLDRPGTGDLRIISVNLASNNNSEPNGIVLLGDFLTFNIKIKQFRVDNYKNIRIIIGVYNILDEPFLRFDTKVLNSNFTFEKEVIQIQCKLLENINIAPGSYYVNIAILKDDIIIDHVINAIDFIIENADYFGTGRPVDEPKLSKVNYKHIWEFKNNGR